MAKAAEKSNVIELKVPEMNIQYSDVILIGDSPLLVNQFSEKARQEILDKQMGRNSKQREKKDPKAQYEGSLYRTEKDAPSEYGFPSIGLKACACRGAKEMAGMDMTKARTSFHIPGELVSIFGKPEIDERMVRLQGTTADVRFRGIFKEWATRFTIKYNADIVSLEQIVSMFAYGGFGCGIGEWRPEKKGSLGMFHVADEADFKPFLKKYGRS